MDMATLLHAIKAAHREANRPLYAAFLDVQKAFDSIDHWHLISILRDVIGLDLQWVEAIRRLLLGNHTVLLGQLIELTRGTFQGSPLSPLLCLCFIEDLSRTLEQHLRLHPEDAPLYQTGALPTALKGDHRGTHLHLVTLLLFADDIALLSVSPQQLERLVRVVGEWAARRGLRLSRKSLLLRLMDHPQAPVPPPVEVPGHGAAGAALDLEWSEVPFKYLGVLTPPYQPHRPGDPPLAIDREVVRRRLFALRRLLTRDRVVYCANIPAYVQMVHQLVLQLALYSAPVRQMDLSASDTAINKALRSAFVLPPTYPTALLRWELGLPPAHLLALQAVLRDAWRTAHHPWFYPLLLREVMERPTLEGGQGWLFGRGPLQRKHLALRTHHQHLLLRQDGVDTAHWGEYDVWEAARRVDEETWFMRVDEVILAQFARWAEEALARYPAGKREIIDRCRHPYATKRRPAFLRLGGALGHIGLRFKAPALDTRRPQDAPPACAWCHAPAAEHGAHLLTCPRQPAEVYGIVQRALAAIATEAGMVLRTAEDRSQAMEAYLRLSWQGQGRAKTMPRRARSTRIALVGMYRVLEAYLASLPPAEQGRIWAVPTLPRGYVVLAEP
jgi:hypothetical protein